MAIAPNTQEFFNLKSLVESEIDSGTITNRKQLKEFLDANDVDFNKFMEVDKEYEKRKKLGVLTPETTFNIGKIIGAGIGKVGEDIGTITKDAVEFVAGKEARETTEETFSDIAKFLDENLPTAVTYTAKEMFDPRVNIAEDIAAEIVSFAAPAGAVTKAAKGIKAVTKLGKATKAGAIGVTADVLSRGEDETFVTEFAQLVPESEQYVKRLAIDPDDSVAERRLKQIVDSAVMGGIIAVPAAVAFKFLKGGGRRLFGRLAAQRNNITEPIEATVTARPIRATVEETAPGNFNQTGGVAQIIGKINTKAARIASSTAGLPKPVFDAFLRKQNYVQASDALIRREAKQLEKLLKREGTDKQLVNRLLMGEELSPQELNAIPQSIQDVVNSMRLKIDNNSILIKDTLGLPEDSKLGAILDPETGGAYLTRTFEFTTNPKWSKDIAKALKFPNETHNADILSAVNGARRHISSMYPDLAPEQVNAILMDMIDRGKRGNSLDLLGEFLVDGAGKNAVKILKGRKDLDRPILEFLGEVKDPVRNFTETMTNQNKLIAKARYIKDIREFAEESLGQEIKLGGLLPYTPTEVTTFLRKAEVTPTRDVRESLEDLAKRELGAFGSAGEAIGLNKYVTTKEFMDMLEKGIDTFGPDSAAGKSFLRTGTQRLAGTGQAMETIFDHTAHMLNVYGMVQQLGMNGILYRPRVAKDAYQAAYNMYQKAAKKDPEALKFLQALKNRAVIDTSVVGENIKKNLDRFGDGTESIEGALSNVIKKPLRGISAAYGGVDDFGKITSFIAEQNAYRQAFPNLTDDQIFNLAADIVRDTMPSYTTASPFVRALSRYPVGTYAVFPAEIVRTTKNILKIGARDVREGIRTNNPALIRIGMRRLAGIGATTTAIGTTIGIQNSQMGVTNNETRAVDMLVPEYQKNTQKMFTEPFYRDPNTKDIMTRFVDSGSIDSMQYVKGPVRAVIGKVLAGQEVTEREIDDILPDIGRELLSPFVSEKFLTEALIDAYRGFDAEGNKLSPSERATGILKVFYPGSAKAAKRVYDAKQSEVLRGEGYGQTATGFPMTEKDAVFFAKTGIRNNTMNLNKAMSYSLYQDQKLINESKQKFTKYIKDIPDKVLTEDDINDLYDAYIEIQMEKKENMARLSDKVNIFRKIEFYETGKDGKIHRERLGINGVVAAATSKGKYKVSDQLLYAATKGPEGQGIFMPDSLNDKEIVNLIIDRKFPPSVIQGLKKIEAALAGQPLRKVD